MSHVVSLKEIMKNDSANPVRLEHTQGETPRDVLQLMEQSGILGIPAVVMRALVWSSVLQRNSPCHTVWTP